MAEFKKGDRVLVKPGMSSRYGWAPEDSATPLTVQRVEHDYRVFVRSPWDGVEYSFRPEDLTHAEPETPADVDKWAAKDALQAEVAAEVFQTTAPLDPAAVKPGDTVTVHVLGLPDMPDYDVTGEVYEFSRPGAGLPLHVGGHSLSDPSVTLTAHTPAPEPEPEWKPGRFVSVRVNGRELPGERYQGFVTHHGTVMVANEDGSPESINLAHLRDVRPLVVIDPTDVDRLWAIIREVDGSHDLGPGALAEAILERLAR